MPATSLKEPSTAAVAEEQVEAVNKPARRSFYKKRERIYPRIPHGRYRLVKWVAMAGLLAVYYLLPWVRWDRGPTAPDQAVLVDIPARKFYFFFIEIWPQEIYYWTGLLILAAIGLFFVTSLFGRVWCGYACPQTVWTDLFIHVERWIEGDRNARMRLDAAPLGLTKIGKKLVKHVIWVVIGLATGGAWVFYFADAPTLMSDILHLQAPAAVYVTMAFLTATTYVFAGLAREQICTYVCPYARFQSAMFDEDTMMVTYEEWRGEPRGKHKVRDGGEKHGDCVDCNLCVAVCPMGIDIRDGQQMECINCALCIDACNGVMEKVGRPKGLIRYDTLRNVSARAAGKPMTVRLLRPRTLIYAALLVIAAAVLLTTLVTRADLDVTLQRDRNPLFVELSDGSIRNGYTFKIINKRHETRDLTLTLEGVEGVTFDVIGHDIKGAQRATLTVPPDALDAFRIFVTAPRRAISDESTELTFVLTDVATGARATKETVFRGPGR